MKINGVEMIKNSSCDDDNMKDNFVSKEKRGGTVPSRFVDSYKEIQAAPVNMKSLLTVVVSA